MAAATSVVPMIAHLTKSGRMVRLYLSAGRAGVGRRFFIYSVGVFPRVRDLRLKRAAFRVR